MDGKLNIIEDNVITNMDKSPLTLTRDMLHNVKSQNNITNIVISFFIYTCAFFIIYYLKNKSINLNVDHIFLFGLFTLSFIISSSLSKKFNYVKRNDNIIQILRLQYSSLLISFTSLIILFYIFQVRHNIQVIIIGSLFFGLIIETIHFIMLSPKKINQTIVFKQKYISLKYLSIDIIILTAFNLIGFGPKLIHKNINEVEFIIITIIYGSWLISAITTHRFLPLMVSNTRWNAFELQTKFYFRIILLSGLSMIFLQLDYSSLFYFTILLFGYSIISALTFMFVFAEKVENKIDDSTEKFLKKYKINQPQPTSNENNRDLKYSFTGTVASDSIVKNKMNFEFLKEYEELFTVLNNMVDLKSFDTRKTIIIKSDEPNDLLSLQPDSYQLFVNLHILNDQFHLNDYLRQIRRTLVKGGVFVGALHPHLYRYNSIINKHSFWIGNTLYFFDLIWKRVFPKLPITREIYFKLRKEKDQAISLAEGLGRLVYTGYKIIDLAVVEGVVYFAVIKNEDSVRKKNSFYSPVYKMERIGKNGKSIYVYKLRTMYPYSEFIQDFVYNIKGSTDGDKITDDFRVPFWGKFFRKYWIDELPMLVNLLKGDVKLVGVRPLSYAKFNLYPPDLQKLRTSTKPGLIPPFYMDLPTTFDGLKESERKYLLAYKRNPVKTDVVYFFKSLYNILIKKARSS